MFKTRVTELLGITYPIMQGAMARVSCPELAAAVSNAGGLGTLTSGNCQSKDELRAQVRKTRSLTDRPFAVNLSLFPSFRQVSNDDFIDVLIEEGVGAVETSGIRAPDQYIARLKQANIKCVHKCTSVKHALSAQKAGADAVTLVGFEQGGAMGPIDTTTMVLIPLASSALEVPVIAGGGIADARGFAAALALGAEGVVMGTRFLMTREAPIHANVMKWMLQCTNADTAVVQRSAGNPHRALRNKAVQKVLELESKGATLEDLRPLIRGENTEVTYREGDVDAGICFIGQAIELINELKTCKEVIEDTVNGAQGILNRLHAVANDP